MGTAEADDQSAPDRFAEMMAVSQLGVGDGDQGAERPVIVRRAREHSRER